MKPKFNDKSVLLALLLLSLIITSIISTYVARTILGFLFVLIVPGYTMTAALYPKKGDLSSLERLVLSFGLSITVIPMLCFALDYTPWGIDLYPVLTIILLLIVVTSCVAWHRRKKLAADDRLGLTLKPNPDSFHFKSYKSVYVSLLAALVFVIFVSIYADITPGHKEQFTEFYVLGPAGLAADYPTSLYSGQEAEVTLGIINHEHQQVNYLIEVRINDEVVESVSPIPLSHRQKWEENVTFVPDLPGQKIAVDFLLFRLGEQEKSPYRRLHLSMDVEE